MKTWPQRRPSSENEVRTNVYSAHRRQLPPYLRLTGLKLGYQLNRGEALMKGRITRTINGEL